MHALYHKIKFHEFKYTLSDISNLCFYSVYFWFFPFLARQERRRGIINTDVMFVKQVFEGYESLIVGFLYNLSFDKIHMNETFYLSIKNDDHNLIILTDFDKYKCTTKPSVKDYKGLNASFLRIRVITKHQIVLQSKRIKNYRKFIFVDELRNNILANRYLPKYNIIFHLHGGGFCSESSYTHCCYLIE